MKSPQIQQRRVREKALYGIPDVEPEEHDRR
jgi:hypothetical protein